jgi:hypothetical protein
MGAVSKASYASLLFGCLTLAGCADCFDDARRPIGIAASAPHRHHTAAPVLQHDAPLSAIDKCTQALYLKSAGSQDDIHAIEDKCRTIIVSQPY